MSFNSILIAGLTSIAFTVSAHAAQPPHAMPGELEVDPYEVSNANAGAEPITDPAVLAAFNGEAGIARIVDGLIAGIQADERIEGVFRASDWPRLRRTLIEQFCYILGGPCDYTGRSMASVHVDHGVTTAEFNALVENLQDAMDAEGVPFAMQNRFLARLAPMHGDVVTR
ncbi:group 1 truncated hemoglobin [uncultured Maricaulis sp.]|uniref:group I truncated hemoglobin n=1 Tax=uncultured Maricaulis sp. TaxID=174710 RepID=UPI0026067E34|nr:group 1 truncated hemoglobin [uncultured Maricaulis sp.]